MEFLADLVPAKEHHGHKSRLDEKGNYSFNGKRGTKNVTHEPGIVAEVGTELKFQNDTGGDTDREVDAEKLHPEFRGVLPELVLLNDINCLHHGHHNRQAESKRNEHPMVAGCKGELRPRPVNKCCF